MDDHARFAVCFWHTLLLAGQRRVRRRHLRSRRGSRRTRIALELAEHKIDAAFEFIDQARRAVLLLPRSRRRARGRRRCARATRCLDRLLERVESAHGSAAASRLLWGTANLFGHPRYAAGAATNPDPEVFAYAAAQVKHCLEATQRLGGANYVLWGGREGYDTLLNTDLRRELDQLGRFLTLVAEHKHRIGFGGTLLIEPKPFEPTKHQYDFDAAAVLRVPAEVRPRARVQAQHRGEPRDARGPRLPARARLRRSPTGSLGSVDANRGDPRLGWDTDQFPNDPREWALAWLEILRGGGLHAGGFNFDAKLRRQSVDATDLFHAHVGGMDAIARGLLAAEAILADGRLERFREERYAAGTTRSAARSSRAARASKISRATCSPTTSSRSPSRGARKCWKTWSPASPDGGFAPPTPRSGHLLRGPSEVPVSSGFSRRSLLRGGAALLAAAPAGISALLARSAQAGRPARGGLARREPLRHARPDARPDHRASAPEPSARLHVSLDLLDRRPDDRRIADPRALRRHGGGAGAARPRGRPGPDPQPREHLRTRDRRPHERTRLRPRRDRPQRHLRRNDDDDLPARPARLDRTEPRRHGRPTARAVRRRGAAG